MMMVMVVMMVVVMVMVTPTVVVMMVMVVMMIGQFDGVSVRGPRLLLIGGLQQRKGVRDRRQELAEGLRWHKLAGAACRRRRLCGIDSRQGRERAQRTQNPLIHDRSP
jgi:hypothetical protein